MTKATRPRRREAAADKGSLLLSTLCAEQGQAATTNLGLPVIGEFAMIDRRPRNASAVCATDTKLLVLPYDQFAAFFLFVPDIKPRLRRLKERRGSQNEIDDLRRKGLAAPEAASRR